MKYQTINGWTKEKMINHIKNEFKGKSINKNGSCQYRGPNGKKCAVGVFIPDNLYRGEMDNGSSLNLTSYNADHIINYYPELEELMPLESWEMSELQMVHDDSNKDQTLEKMLYWIEQNVTNGV